MPPSPLGIDWNISQCRENHDKGNEKMRKRERKKRKKANIGKILVEREKIFTRGAKNKGKKVRND
jgi:hypothetical protein